MRPENKQRLELRRKIEEAYKNAHGQWTGCNWSTEWGRCKIDLKDVTEKQAQDRAERYAAIAEGEKLGDPELRQLQRAAKYLDPMGETAFSASQVAAALALGYEEALAWLHSVEVDAAEAEQLAGAVMGNVFYAWSERKDECFLKARTLAEQLTTLEEKYASNTSTWSDFRAALAEYRKPEPFAGH